MVRGMMMMVVDCRRSVRDVFLCFLDSESAGRQIISVSVEFGNLPLRGSFERQPGATFDEERFKYSTDFVVEVDEYKSRIT